eukprot:CAMPEP_0170518890 /NCGR_PEP_ID=MMETSP0209-20121228/4489_1 /TAXON_ID=665100 ORGANISM="Litonotus pictus, Strain P1" /NCGR_SAMPLE_ID=MMETSP0209 /ASSEMBLY_ACC=CAM_ASM_000301 /LENGTH=104 /DNA_ID=CAMNT_0010804637 /DNA_START=600 /DNA_END=911 /DNA_ORIENTATION=+
MLSEENFKYDSSKKYTPPNAGVERTKSSGNDEESSGERELYILPQKNNELGGNKVTLDMFSNGSNPTEKPRESFGRKEVRLFNKETQITSGGDIRTSLSKDITK